MNPVAGPLFGRSLLLPSSVLSPVFIAVFPSYASESDSASTCYCFCRFPSVPLEQLHRTTAPRHTETYFRCCPCGTFPTQRRIYLLLRVYLVGLNPGSLNLFLLFPRPLHRFHLMMFTAAHLPFSLHLRFSLYVHFVYGSC